MVAKTIDDIIKEQLNYTLNETEFSNLGELYRGKVRDNYTKKDIRIIH